MGVAGVAAAAVGRAADVGVVVPAPAPEHTGTSVVCALRISHHAAAQVVLIPIQAPIIYVSVHVIKPPGVGQIGADLSMLRISAFAIVLIEQIAANFIHIRALIFAS